MYGRPRILIFLLRLSLGWILFYSGLTKVFDSNWSSKAYLMSAGTFGDFYRWLALPANIGWVDFLNKWGQLAIGGALILGVAVSWAALAGALMMGLYYFPSLNFPIASEHYYLIDEHIVFLLAFLLLIRLRAGTAFSVSQIFRGPWS